MKEKDLGNIFLTDGLISYWLNCFSEARLLPVSQNVEEGVVQSVICRQTLLRVYHATLFNEVREKRQVLSVSLFDPESLSKTIQNRLCRHLWNRHSLRGELSLQKLIHLLRNGVVLKQKVV